ncbi:MAG: M24 family metallopeptidase [Chloroflexota bacterium]
MQTQEQSATKANRVFPQVLPVRQRAEVVQQILKKRLKTILPMAMRETGFDMWLILCQEDDLDPVFRTLMPVDTWCPILQMLVFYDRGEEEGVEGINISGTNTHDLYDRPYTGQIEGEQWPLLMKTIEERDPKRIGINTSSIQWAADGLTHNLYLQLIEKLPPKYVDRLEPAEPLATRWLATLTDEEVELYEHVANVDHHLIAECYSRKAIIAGQTTLEDLRWYYRQRCAELGLKVASRPRFRLVRSEGMKERYGEDDQVIRPGDFVHCDVGIHYLRLNTDIQEWVYVLQPDEEDVPEGMKHLMAEANRLQDIFMSEFKLGLTGDELLENILTRARREGVPKPRVYSHSLGLFLHEPGPLIGLPWEQESCAGRGAVKLEYNYTFTMELSIHGPLPEWGGQEINMALEEGVVFTKQGCRLIDGRQTEFYLI